MAAVAPQTMSPSSSKKWTGCSSGGEAPPLLVVDVVGQQLGQRDVQDGLDLVRRRHQVGPGRPARPTNGTM